MAAMHAGYVLHFDDDAFAVVGNAIKALLIANCDDTTIEKIVRKGYHSRVVQGETQSLPEFIVQNLIDLSLHQIISAQIHVNRRDNIVTKDVNRWHAQALTRPDKTAYVKKVFVSFNEGIVALQVCIDAKQVYVTVTNKSALKLQAIKQRFNSAQSKNSEFIADVDLRVPLSIYIHHQ